MATGERDIVKLVEGMEPVRNEGTYVFVTVPESTDTDARAPPIDRSVGTFREREGLTLILEQGVADRYGYEYSSLFSWITLSVHSSLEAVGLTACFSNALAEAGVSCNVVAGYYHDHIFVDHDRAEQAMDVLKSLASKTTTTTENPAASS